MNTTPSYSDSFTVWAKEKLRADGEYIRVLARHGSLTGKGLARMIIEAAGDGKPKKEGES